MTTVFERFGNYVSGAVDTVKDRVSSTVDQVKKDFEKSFSPSTTRMAAAGLAKGGVAKTNAVSTTTNFANANNDWRVKISLASASDIFYKSSNPGVMAPLTKRGGVIFPYTPSITMTHSAMYSQDTPVHSNYPFQFYQNSAVNQISIRGDFTAQTQEEAQYVLACIYFFRSATKMFYGNSEKAGNPPPIVYLNGYGDGLFSNVPCVIQSFVHELPDAVDYITAPDASSGVSKQSPMDQQAMGTGSTRVPTKSSLTVTLMPVYSRTELSGFSLEDFAAGKLVSKGFV